MNDRKGDLLALREALLPLGETVILAETAADALAAAQANDVAVAVVDIRMPAIDGFEMVAALRRDAQRRDLPVIFVTAFEMTEETVKRVYELGAADLVMLPVMPAMLRCKVEVFVKLHRQVARERAYAVEVREAAATEVHDLQERFRLLVDSVSDYALLFLDPLGLVTDWTSSAEHLLGYSAGEVVGQHFRFIFTPADRTQGKPERELEIATTEGQSRDDTLHLKRDGSAIPITGRTIALKEPSGALRGFAKIMRDASQLQALRDSEAKFREIFETANEGIWMLDANMAITTANRRMAEILGVPRPELVGRRMVEFAFPEDAAYIQRLFDERRAGKHQSAIEVRFRHQNGSVVWTLLSGRPVFRGSEFAGALDLFTDITPRRMAENRFRVFFESSAAGHALIDPATRRFTQVNRRYCEIAGRTEAELLELTFTDITHPEDRPSDETRVEELYAGRASELTMEKRYVRPDASSVWVSLTTTLVRTPDGRPLVQASVIQDITQKKATELELAESRTRLRLAIDIADLGVFYRDGDVTIYWSPHVKQQLGMQPDEPISAEAFLQRVHPEDRDRVRATLDRALSPPSEEFEWTIQYRVVWPDGTVRWLQSTGISNPREDQDLFHMIGVVRDITADKEFATELARQIGERTRELEEKNQQLQSFAYTVAHDLRAPLRAINGYADYALEDIAPLHRPETNQYLERIRASTQRLDRLVTDLLAYSRVNQVEVHAERVDLQRVVDTVLHELQAEISRTGASVSVTTALPPVHADRSVLEQVVLNLIGNALKFTHQDRAPEVDISASDDNGMVRLSIRDRGIGIAREYHQRIFKVFERLQASRPYPGTGIGLAIVARAMDRMGGRYGVESAPGKGSTFWIELKPFTP